MANDGDKPQGPLAVIWDLYKKLLVFIWKLSFQTVTAAWNAAQKLIGDMRQRSGDQSGQTEKQPLGPGENQSSGLDTSGHWLTPKRKERVIGIGVIVIVCVVLFPLLQKVRKVGQDGIRRSGDFVPHIPGTSREYLHAMYPPGDSVPIVTLNHVLHKDTGAIESTIARTGRLKNPAQDLALDNIEWLVDGSNTSTSFHRVKDGFVERGSPSAGSGTMEWEPVFKIGAEPDDTWEWNPSPGVKKTYTVTKKTTWNGKPALIVREEMALPNNGAIIVFHTYAAGVGKVDSSASMIQPGQSPAMQKTYDQKIVEPGANPSPGSKTTTNVTPQAEQRKVAYKVSKGFLKGELTVELSPSAAAEINLKEFEVDGNRLVFLLTSLEASGRSRDPWHYSVFDGKGTKLEAGVVMFSGAIGVGETVKSHVFIGHENVSAATRVFIDTHK